MNFRLCALLLSSTVCPLAYAQTSLAPAPTRSVIIEALKHQPPPAPATAEPLYKTQYEAPQAAYLVPPLAPYAGPRKPIKNIIFMIGDGMGPAQVMGGLLANHGQLFMQQAQATGLSLTQNQYGKITDSAASATAMATGHKTYNAALGTDSAGQQFRSIMHDARAHGKATGMVVACELTDATPAAFAIVHPNRNEHEAIATKYLAAPIDFMYAGGLQYFTQRKDGQNLLLDWQRLGYQVATTPAQAAALTGPKAVALLAPGGPKPVAERTAAYMKLGVDKALDILGRDKDGFFLLIEGSQIDDAGHFNNTTYNVQEVLDFDQQVGRAFAFAAANGETLVIVTADHETGGYSLVEGDAQAGKVVANFASHQHTAIMVPVFAYGPGSELFTGLYQNTDLYLRLKKALGWQ